MREGHFSERAAESASNMPCAARLPHPFAPRAVNLSLRILWRKAPHFAKHTGLLVVRETADAAGCVELVFFAVHRLCGSRRARQRLSGFCAASRRVRPATARRGAQDIRRGAV